VDQQLLSDDWVDGKKLLLRKGKKDYALLTVDG